MKEAIYTIPVLDSFRGCGECPFCAMTEKLDRDAVDFVLGPSYMEDDIRRETNKLGFCREHYRKMFTGKNRLGLALMVHTHLHSTGRELEKMSGGPSIKGFGKKGMFSKTSEGEGGKMAEYLREVDASCYICKRVDETYDRYLDTFFLLWKQNGEMRELVKSCKGFCFSHLADLLEMGEKKLNAKEYQEFTGMILPLQMENIKRLEEDLDWFIKKFDYRYNEEPWKNAKDALPRTILKLSSDRVDS